MVRVGVIGCGYWGPNLIRNFVKVEGCQVVAAADVDPIPLTPLRRLYPATRFTTESEALLASDEVDAVAIATPISTHYTLAREALRRGKHVLVEKPLTATVPQAEELIDLADRQRRILMVDHTFIYTGAVQKIKELIRRGELGEIYYYDAVRVNLGLFQNDVNVLWDLAPHDFSIMTFLLDRQPLRVSAEFADETLAHFHLNWLSPVKIRRTLIGGSLKIVVYDHLDPDNQVKIFDRGVEVLPDRTSRYRTLVQYRTGDMVAPKIDQSEALEQVCRHFVDCVLTGQRPITDGTAGLRVVQLLEAAQHSLDQRGVITPV